MLGQPRATLDIIEDQNQKRMVKRLGLKEREYLTRLRLADIDT